MAGALIKNCSRWFACGAPLVLLLSCSPQIAAAASVAGTVKLGESVVNLYGPWKFRTGDNPKWSVPAFDDGGWQTLDLTPRPGATDGDVGLPGFVPGWSSQGHPGYYGYAWYRIHLMVRAPQDGALAFLGPWAVDSAYQIYINGKLAGGVGNFSGPTPTAYGYHYPMMFTLPPGSAHGGSLVIAIRTWMGPWGVGVPGSGGIHIAPAIGAQGVITNLYRLQWLKIFEGYMVDAVPAALFLLMAIIVLALWFFDRADRTYPWLAAALILSALERGNHAFFFWFKIETIQELVWVFMAFIGSLTLAAWMMAWRGWLKVDRPRWLAAAVLVLTLLLILVQIMSRPWLFGVVYPATVAIGLHYLIVGLRLAFLFIFAWVLYQGILHHGRDGWHALPAAFVIGIVLFSPELSAIRVPGIWFPWGVGLSLSECASVVFDLLFAMLLLQRLWSYPRSEGCRNEASGELQRL